MYQNVTYNYLWPPKAAIIFYRCNFFFYFVGIDERPAMGSQPNLACRSEVVSLCKCPTKILGSPKNWGGKHHIFTTFLVTSALDTAYPQNEMSHRQTELLVSIYYISPTSTKRATKLIPGYMLKAPTIC